MSLSVASFDFHRVLVSGLVKSTRDAVQSVLAGLPDGPAFATPVETDFEDAVAQCRKQCAAIHKHCQKHNTCYRDTEFETDVDLQTGRRMCLEGLDLSVEDDDPLDPKSAGRVRVSLQYRFYDHENRAEKSGHI